MHLKKKQTYFRIFILIILQLVIFFERGHTANNISSAMLSQTMLSDYENIFKNSSYINLLNDTNEITRIEYDTSNLRTLVNIDVKISVKIECCPEKN